MTPEKNCKELGLLHGFAARRLFEGMTAAGSLEWERAQFQYLKRVRKRPGGCKGSQVTPTRVWDSSKVAGGHNFAKAAQLQQKPLIVRGLMAAHEAKRWCVSQGLQIEAMATSFNLEPAWFQLLSLSILGCHDRN